MKTWEQQVAESQAPLAPKRIIRPNNAASWILAGFGLVAAIILYPLGIAIGFIMIVIAVCIDQKKFICGACGNRVEKTSTLCPACQSGLH